MTNLNAEYIHIAGRIFTDRSVRLIDWYMWSSGYSNMAYASDKVVSDAGFLFYVGF